MFNMYLAKLNDIAQNAIDNSIVEIQKLQSYILNSYTSGDLTDREKRALYSVSEIIMDDVRNALNIRREHHGLEKIL